MSKTYRVGSALLVLGGLVLVGLPTALAAGASAADCKSMAGKMDANKVTLNKATEAAEAHSKGKATLTMAKMDGGKLVFESHCMVGDKVQAVWVDEMGKAMKMEESKATADKSMPSALATVTLAKAVEAAEAHAKGKSVGAMAKMDGGKLAFEVYCTVGDKLNKVWVDNTGKATKMEEAKEMALGGAEAPKPAPKPGG